MNPLPEGTRRIRKKSKAVSGQRTQAKTVKSTKKVADVSQKTGMPNCRFLQLNEFIDRQLRSINNKTYGLIWIAIWRHTLNDRAEISHSRLAKGVGVSGSTVKRAVKELIRLGYLTKIKQGGLVAGTNIYQPRFPIQI
jgi:hypothetical protein